jgi:tetratricopeptide (TPR) repeat protein
MWTYENLARLFRKSKRPADCERAWQESIAVAVQLNREFPNAYADWLANETLSLADLLIVTGRREEAEKLMAVQTPEQLNGVAWRLSTDADPNNRNPALAVILAKLAVARAPSEGYIVNTLGTAYYRAGDWKAAIETLKEADHLYQGQQFSSDAFFIAMSHWQLGEKEAARKWYDAGAHWMVKFAADNDEQRRFRAEAAGLLGLADPSATLQPTPLDERQLYTLIVDAWKMRRREPTAAKPLNCTIAPFCAVQIPPNRGSIAVMRTL